MQDFQASELKKSWEESMAKKKEVEAARRAIKDIEFDKCGPSSAVRFSGEDMTKYERKTQQQNQMKRWTQEQMYERAYQKRIEKEEDMAYAEMIKTVDSIRESSENEELELARYSRQLAKEQNFEVHNIIQLCFKLFIILTFSWQKSNERDMCKRRQRGMILRRRLL